MMNGKILRLNNGNLLAIGKDKNSLRQMLIVKSSLYYYHGRSIFKEAILLEVSRTMVCIKIQGIEFLAEGFNSSVKDQSIKVWSHVVWHSILYSVLFYNG